MLTWIEMAEVTERTGVIVGADEVNLAQSIIEILADVAPTESPEDDGLKARDRHRLVMAVAFQAAWLKGQVDVTSRLDLSTLTQDAASLSYAHLEGVFLAPLAKRCLDQLSWNRSRMVGATGSKFNSISEWEAAYLRDEADGGAPWEPITGSL